MSILEKYREAFATGNIELLNEVVHEDCKFIPHVGSAVFTKDDVMGIAGSGMVNMESHRILYENDEVGVDHGIAHFSNGSTSEAVLAFYRFKDGKIIHVETGATPLSDDYQLIGS